MNRRSEVTAFYIETLVMITVMIGILLVLTQILGISRRESVRAKRLTEAVTIAQNTAEALAACAGLEEVPEFLGLTEAAVEEKDGAVVCRGTCLWNRSSGKETDAGEIRTDQTTAYRIEIIRTETEGLAEDRISVYAEEGGEAVYTLTVRNRTGRKEAA